MILSRYFYKSDYGTYKQVLYVYNTLLTVFTLGLPKAFSYFLPRVPICQAKHLIKKISNLFFLLGGIFSLVLFAFSKQTATILNNPDLEDALRIFAIVPLLMMPTMGLEGILATYKKTKFMAVYTCVTRLMMLLSVALPVMIWNLGYRESIIGFVIGSFLSFILALYLKYYPVKGMGEEKCEVTYKEIFRFSLPLLYASIWGIIINSTDQFFISRYFGNQIFADFSNGSMELPFIGMITGACAAVLSPIFSKMSHDKVDPLKEIYPLWMSVFRKTAMLIYPIVVYCIVFADVVMVVLYGQQYDTSADYFHIKLIANFFSLIAYAPLIINTGHVRYYSNVHMYCAVLTIIAEYISVLTINSPYAISWISMLSHVGRIFAMLFLVAKIFDIKIHKLFPTLVLAKILIPSIIILIFLRFVLFEYLSMSSIVILIVSLSAYSLIYIIYAKITKLNYLQIIKPLVSRK